MVADPPAAAAALYVVATPIGNLADTTKRALSVLADVDLILAEDTRRTRKLLEHYAISTPVQSLHEHNERRQTAGLIRRLVGGESMALVSDAGTPLISDPGFVLVRDAVAAEVPVVPVPGPSAPLAALVGSGLPTDRFIFLGYLPRKAGARRRLLDEIAGEPGTIVFLESPRRIAASLADAAEVLGDRPVAVGRELTKVHEEFVRGTLPDVSRRLAATEVRGEVTVCIGGRRRGAGPRGAAIEPADLAEDRDALEQRLRELRGAGAERSEALRALADELGVSRRELYRALLAGQDEEDLEEEET